MLLCHYSSKILASLSFYLLLNKLGLKGLVLANNYAETGIFSLQLRLVWRWSIVFAFIKVSLLVIVIVIVVVVVVLSFAVIFFELRVLSLLLLIETNFSLLPRFDLLNFSYQIFIHILVFFIAKRINQTL